MSVCRHPILGWWGYTWPREVYCQWWSEADARATQRRHVERQAEAVLARLVYWEAES